jgi:hypothetical protein
VSKTSLDEILNYLRPLTRRAIVLQENKAFEHAQKKMPAAEVFKRIVIDELKKRPISERSTSGVRLYQHLESLHLLGTVLSESVLDGIRSFLEMFEVEERLRSLEERHMSSLNVAAEFHVSVLRELYSHIFKLNEILQRHDVPAERLRDYISGCQQEMMRQLRAISPLYPFGKVKLSTTSTESEQDLIPAVYNTVDDALKAAGYRRGRRELCIQLTHLFCSTSDFLSQHFTAEAVRKEIERIEKRRIKKVGKTQITRAT